MKDPLVIKCADKYRVRDYVKQCGCGSILNELIGVYDSPKEIPWEELPNQFALKWNFGAGMNIICTDKSKMKKDDVIQQLEKWSKCKCWLSHSEMQYKYIPKKIIIEKYLEEDSRKTISDYKVYCFHSKPIAIMVMHDRENNLTAEFFDKNWNKLSISKYKEPTTRTEIPNCLKEMLDASRELSRPFPFVRIDYYVIKNRLVFGELTFTPAGGLYLSQTDVAGRNMSDFLSIM
jgi:hypothetical protein